MAKKRQSKGANAYLEPGRTPGKVAVSTEVLEALDEFVNSKLKVWGGYTCQEDEMFEYYYRLGAMETVKAILNNAVRIPGIERVE